MATSSENSQERLEDIIDALVAVARGDYDSRIELAGDNEAMDALAMGINMVVEELKENIERLEHRVRERTKELEGKINIIGDQKQAILELSTPVIQVWDNVLILPLIGTMDTLRAQQVIDNLLDTIVTKQAAVAIIDITGVPVVDTKVANHLLKTIEAAKMLGTDSILTGVSPHNAQTLVKLGVELSQITTKGSLQAGLKLAFERTNLKVTNAG